MTQGNDTAINHRNILYLVFAGSLALRLVYFLLVLSEYGLENYFTLLPDSVTYWKVSQHLFGATVPDGAYWLFQVGPGYPVLLGLLSSVSGGSKLFIFLFHAIMGGLAPIAVYKLTQELFKHAKVSFIAAVLTAVSPTSIALSSNILSDQIFYTLFVFSLYLLVKGLNQSDNRALWYSGILLTCSLYIRSVVSLYPFLLLLLLLLVPDPVITRKKLFKKLLIPLGLFVVGILIWSSVNYVNNDLFTFGGNGVRAARIRLCAMAVARNSAASDYLMVNKKWDEADSLLFINRPPTIKEGHQLQGAKAKEVFAEHPGWVVSTYFSLVWENMRKGNYFPESQLSYVSSIGKFLRKHTEYWFAYLMIIVVGIGCLRMFRAKQYLPLLLLGSVYIYFSLIGGFSFWQGSRLHYPAELTWVISMGYLYVGLIQKKSNM